VNDVRVNDWIAFMRDNRIVIAHVLYRAKDRMYPYDEQAVTDSGRVRLQDVLEVRRAPEPAK
jgi:hypothetical protein